MGRNDGRGTDAFAAMSPEELLPKRAETEAALDRIAETIGRHLAREQIRERNANFADFLTGSPLWGSNIRIARLKEGYDV